MPDLTFKSDLLNFILCPQINGYKEKFYEETLVLITEGTFNLIQVLNHCLRWKIIKEKSLNRLPNQHYSHLCFSKILWARIFVLLIILKIFLFRTGTSNILKATNVGFDYLHTTTNHICLYYSDCFYWEKNVFQICDAICILSTFYPDDKKRCHEMVDKLWSGIMDKSEEINVDTFANVFNTLPHLKQVIASVHIKSLVNFYRRFLRNVLHQVNF